MCMDEFGHHEVLDRSYVLLEQFYDHIESHPVVQNHPALLERAEAISSALSDFYQAAGQAADDFDERKKK